MAKPDDSSIDEDDLLLIRSQAERLLVSAGAKGVFPTPVDQILEAAGVVVGPPDALDDGLLRRLRRKAGGLLKRALAKVLGIFDAVGRVVYIDRGIYVVRQTFLKLHESAHAWLPAHRHAYRIVEDSDKELSPEISDLFDRQANAFASEVLFQLDTFTEEAAGFEFGFSAPLKLQKKFGSSIYAAIRRYVSHNHRACAVLVLNPPEFVAGPGHTCSLRRFVASPEFMRKFGRLRWQDQFTPSDAIGRAIPLAGRRMSGRFTLVLKDRNGARHECVAEGFTQSHQVFVLICPIAALKQVSIVVP